MLRAILGVVVGYIVSVILIIGGFTALQLGLGNDRVYQPASWHPTMLFNISSLVLGLIGAAIGGMVCGVISRSMTTVKVFAGLILIFGVIAAVFTMGQPEPGPRPADAGPMDSAKNARTPTWVAFANPVVGAVGIMIGGGMTARKPKR